MGVAATVGVQQQACKNMRAKQKMYLREQSNLTQNEEEKGRKRVRRRNIHGTGQNDQKDLP
jgi:hypothetical protein